MAGVQGAMKLMKWMLAVAALWPPGLCAQVELAGIFGDRMVIQRDRPITIWGTAAPGAEVAVTLGEDRAAAKADESGQWKAEFAARPASGPVALQAASGGATAGAKDVMIGDVWLAAGQSNMVLALQSTTEWPEVKTQGEFPGIRICKLPGDFAFEPAEQYSRALRWETLNSARAGYFSGVAYHFARTVQPALGRAALGVVQASAGGTQAEQWTPEAALKAALPENPLFAMRDKAREKAATGAKVGSNEAGATALYNGTIHPLRHAKFAGVVWYQGEANSRSKRDYRPVLETLVESWRALFGEPDLPFVIVQLPKFGLPKDDGWMRVQEAQMLAARDLGLPLVVTIDEGSAETIHPPNKAEIGRRAGLAALQHVYKQDVEGTAPAMKSVKFLDGGAAVEFDGFKGDLVLKGGRVEGFELAGADGMFHSASAEIKGRNVFVKSADVKEPKAVRYLWANSPPNVTLYSAAGLPAGPFRTGVEK